MQQNIKLNKERKEIDGRMFYKSRVVPLQLNGETVALIDSTDGLEIANEYNECIVKMTVIPDKLVNLSIWKLT